MRRFLLCLGALIVIGSATAQSHLKPRNNLTLPLTSPLDVEIHLKSEVLGYRDYVPISTGNLLGDTIAYERMRSKEDNIIRPALARLQASMLKKPRADSLAAAIRSELEATGKISVGNMQVFDAARPVPAVQPGDDSRNVLVVACSYEMDSLFLGFVVRLHARYGARSEAIEITGKHNLTFMQRLEHRETAPRGGFFSFVEDATRHWESVGAEGLDRRIDAGLRDLAAMLAYELQQKPKFGRIPGKQFGVAHTYGAIETERSDRAWLRLRNGELVSLPVAEVHKPR